MINIDSMPANLTETNDFPSTITVPTAGDPVSAGPGSLLRGALQALTNRSRFLYELLTGGVRKLRFVESYAALKALTGMAKGSVAVVYIGNFPHLFCFLPSDSLPSQVTDMVYPADDETGFWMSERYWFNGVNWTFGALTASSLNLSGVFTGKGRFRRRILKMANEDTTVSVSDFDAVFLPAGVQTTNRTIELTNVGAVDGDVFRVFTQDSARYVTVTTTVGTISIPLQLDLAQRSWCELTFFEGFWRLSAYGDQLNT